MVYAVSENGVAALRTMSRASLGALEELIDGILAVKSEPGKHPGVLGPHEQDLEEAIGEIAANVKNASGTVKEIAGKLDKVADSYQRIIDRKRFNSPAAGGTAAAAAGGMSGSGAVSGGGSAQSVQSIQTWISKVNPHYGNPFIPQSTVNCGSCAFAVEARLNGDMNATATLVNIPTDEAMEAATGKKCVYMEPSGIEEYLISRGAGSHAIVGINREHPLAGHWFNVFYDGERVYTLEGQSGHVYEFPHDYGRVTEWCIMCDPEYTLTKTLHR